MKIANIYLKSGRKLVIPVKSFEMDKSGLMSLDPLRKVTIYINQKEVDAVLVKEVSFLEWFIVKIYS